MDDAENVVAGAGQQQRTGGAGSTTDGSLGSDLPEMVEMKVSAREKMKRIRGFKKFIEKSGEVVEKIQTALGDTALNARKQSLIVAPVEKYCVELRERFEEVRCDGWQKQVLKWMKEKAVDTVEELREECEKAGDGDEEEKMELEKEIEALRKAKKCLQIFLEDRNLEIADEMERAEAKVESLQKKLEAAEKLVEKLKRSMTKEKSASEGLKEQIAHLERSQLKEQIAHLERSQLESREESWESASRGSRQSMVEDVVRSMAEIMRSSARAAALPAPNAYDGTGDFREFRRAFLLKYQSVTESDEELVAILESQFLKGPAKSIFKSLRNRHERSIKELFEEFGEKLRKRQGDARTEALNVFEGLRRSPKQKMWEYCIEIEKWSKKAFGEIGEETMSQLRVTKLMKAISQDALLHRVLITKRLEVKLEDQYEVFKDIVLQHENEEFRMNQQMGSFGGEKWKRRECEKEKSETGKKSSDGEDTEVSAGRRDVGERRAGDARKCFNCGGVGHMANQCTSKWLNVVEVGKKEEDCGAGKRMVEKAEILGKKQRIIIDSGAVVSVISTGLLGRLNKNWEGKVEILEKPGLSLIDASKRKMTVVGQMKTRIRVRGIAADVIFQIVENKGNVFLLGTNAFASMGVELNWKAKKSPTNVCRKEHNGKVMATEKKENHVVNVISLDKKGGVKRVERTREMKKEKNGALDNANSDREAESLKKEVMLRNQPQKPIIQEKYVLVGQRMGLRSKAVFEVRTSAIPTWKQKFGWEKVEKAVLLVEWTKKEKELKALVHLVEEIAKDVREVVVVPARMDCRFDEVDEVTAQWQKMTAANVEIVDPRTPVGQEKTPWILSELKPGSLEKVVEYLSCAIPSHPLVDRLRAEVENSEPRMKNHRAN